MRKKKPSNVLCIILARSGSTTVKNKNIAISRKAKVCIFDYPHSTLFWDAFNKGLKTVLVYETRNNRQISKKYLSLYDLIINPKSDNWEEPFNNLIQ